MDRVIGGVLGLAAFATVTAVSVAKGLPFSQAALRAFLAMLLGYWVGRVLFGPAGLAVVKEAAGPAPPKAEAPAAGPEAPKPAGPGPADPGGVQGPAGAPPQF
jgi:hypothetical protein